MKRVMPRPCFFSFRAAEDAVPVFAAVAAVRLVITVAEFNVVSQRRRRGAGHVTEWAFVVAHCIKPTRAVTKLSYQCNRRAVCS